MIDERLEWYIKTFSPESQARLRRDLERYETYEEQCRFIAQVHRDRCKRVLDFLDELERPFYVRAWKCLKEFALGFVQRWRITP